MKEQKHKIWLEFRAKEATPNGGISVDRSVKFGKEIDKIAEKHGFDCFCKGFPKEVLDYEPSGKTIQIEKLSDIIEKLTPEQFEMFLIDLRKWIEAGRQIKEMYDNPEKTNELVSILGVEIKTEENWNYIKEGMKWIDSGEHKIQTTVHIES